MGPLVPDIIGYELNLVIAIFIGMAFGFILEQAGFSSSRKLVGLFYGYDFTVLRVFFIAGVTAMLGIIALNHFGLLDMSLVYINPTFLWSAIVGGVIMGLGFVIGGFCPGTSVCAAAIGKIDAFLFIAGSMLGVWLFAEGYPLWEALYKSANWGYVQMFTTLGISSSLFAFLLTAMAVSAFWAVSLIEKKVSGHPGVELRHKRFYIICSLAALALGLAAFRMPDRKQMMLHYAETADHTNVALMSVDELAFRLIDQDDRLQIFNVISDEDADSLILPRSTMVTLESLFDRDMEQKLALSKSLNVFVAGDEAPALRAAILAQRLGHENIYVLQGGLDQFRRNILHFMPPTTGTPYEWPDALRFRQQASMMLPPLVAEYKRSLTGVPVKKERKRVLGGC
ncbi:YeeE/YedE family protein [candidate division KSB1 bacterium]|nr:YeeE/YedE family protein [candidate division KSB1 bacterium]